MYLLLTDHYSICVEFHVVFYCIHRSATTLKPLSGDVDNIDLHHNAMFYWETLGASIRVNAT